MTPLEKMARRAEVEPQFLAHALRLYADTNGLDDSALASRLGCAPESLTMLRLCMVPVAGSGTFRDEVEAVAARYGANARALASVLRHVQVLTRLREARSTGPGTLLAARDADPPEYVP